MCANRGRRPPPYPHPNTVDSYGSSSYIPPTIPQPVPHPYSYSSYGVYGYQYGTSNGHPANYSQEGQWSHEREVAYNPGPWRREYAEGSTRYGDYGATSYPMDAQVYGNGYQHVENYQPYSQAAQPESPRNYSGYDNYSRYPSTAGGYTNTSSSYSGYSDYRANPTTYDHPNTHQHDGGEYSNYRRPAPDANYHRREAYTTQQRRSASPTPGRGIQSRGYASQTRPMITKPYLFKPGSLKASSPPPPPRRTEPTGEYLSISLQSPSQLSDPSSSRKLVVLDLNGSLVLRSAHQRRALPRYGGKGRGDQGAPFDPYADPTQLRPLRVVHRRPYLTSFTSYILHDDTKKWLDTMVWSSAQPHSVDDMVDRCFGERRSELRAVWARDTLGLTADDYHKKSLTLKDLAKPWAELPYFQPSLATHPPPTSTSPSSPEPPQPESQPASSPLTPTQTSEPQHHSARTTLLVDDSPLKAMLQPWNHLCIPEYVQEMRNLDLVVVDWEVARERTEKTRRDLNAVEMAHVKRQQMVVKSDEVEAMEKEPVNSVQGSSKSSDEQEKVEVSVMTAEGDQEVGVEKEHEEKADEHEPSSPMKRGIRDIAMIDGELVNKVEVLPKITPELAMSGGEQVAPPTADAEPSGENTNEQPQQPPSEADGTESPFIANQKRKAKKLAKKEKTRKEREAFISLHQRQRVVAVPRLAEENANAREQSTSGLTQAEKEGGEDEEVETQEVELRYDETLLAVVGILDHLKHEANVAGWMRSGGLLHTTLPPTSSTETTYSDSNPEVVEAHSGLRTATKHSAPSRGVSPLDVGSPTKRRRIDHGSEDAADENSMDAQATTTQPEETHEPPSSPTTELSQIPSSPPPSEEQELTGIPLSSPIPSSSVVSTAHSGSLKKEKGKAGKKEHAAAPSRAGLWYEHPVVLLYWANRGRRALNELGIEAESGMRVAPGQGKA